MNTWADRAISLYITRDRSQPAIEGVDSISSLWLALRDTDRVLVFDKKNMLYILLFWLLLPFAGRGCRRTWVYLFSRGEFRFISSRASDYLFHSGRQKSSCQRARLFRDLDRLISVPRLMLEETISGTVDGSVRTFHSRMMFYTNERGKLLFFCHDPAPVLLKTSTSSEYMLVLENESANAGKLTSDEGLVPRHLGKLVSGARIYFIEEYFDGVSMKDALEESARLGDVDQALAYLETIDGWYQRYAAGFAAATRPIFDFYPEVFAAFSAIHAGDGDVFRNVERLKDELLDLSRTHGGIAGVMVHGDLWPANFLHRNGRCVVIDWERSRHDSSPIFEYYWMIISTCMVYQRRCYNLTDYGAAFRHFLLQDDAFSRTCRDKILSYLDGKSIPRKHYDAFLQLFLVEWSIQGHLTYGYQTAMDSLSYDELKLYFCEECKGGVTQG